MKKILKKVLSNKKIVAIIISTLILLLLIMIILFLFAAKKDLNSKNIKDKDIYIYFGKEKFDFKGNITLDHDNKITNIKLNNKKVELYSEPIYYTKEKSVILPVDYSVVNTSLGIQNKISYYTEIVNRGDDFYLVNNELDYKLNNNFLFDGCDLYIFIKPSKVTFNNEKIDISPLSFVNYVFDTRELYIYDYENDKIKYYDNVSTDVFVSNENYKINLSSDNMIYKSKEKLLMKNFNYLKKLK